MYWREKIFWAKGRPMWQGQQFHRYKDVCTWLPWGIDWQYLPGNTLSRRQSPGTGRSAVSLLPRCTCMITIIVTKIYLITMGEAIGWQCLPGNTQSRRQSPGTGRRQSHCYQDVPNFHGGGNRLAVFTRQHSEQKAVPRRSAISLLPRCTWFPWGRQ